MNDIYLRLKTLFEQGQYGEVVSTYRHAAEADSKFVWLFNNCALYCSLAYAHLGKCDKAVEMFRAYMSHERNRRPQLALQKCGPEFIVRLEACQPASWYELWQQVRYEIAPIEALVEDFWSPDLAYNDHEARQPIYEALQRYGKDAIPALLDALARNDWNDESLEQERPYPKLALVNIGDPAFEALVEVIFSEDGIKVDREWAGRLPRAAIKMLYMFGDERAAPILRRAFADPDVRYKPYIEEQLNMIESRRRRGRSVEPRN